MTVLPSDMPVIYDAVSLQHAAASGRLHLLANLHGYRPAPRWTEHVKGEVEDGAAMLASRAWCQPVLDFAWLGDAAPDYDLGLTFRLQTLMNSLDDDDDKNLGEAQCMSAAIHTSAYLVTDDRRAYNFAAKRPELGTSRVKDFCRLLFDAEREGFITRSEVDEAHDRVADCGRTMLCARHADFA